MDRANTESYFRQLCEQVGFALIATDGELKIRTWNAAAGRMFGAASELMLGTTVLSVIPQDRRIAAERMFHRAIEAGESSELEFQHRDIHGLERELSGSIAPVVNQQGKHVGASICIRDVTRRIRLQAEIHENRKMAALGEMAGAIAHHFNNILGGIVTSVDFASANPDPAVTRRVLEQTSRSLIRASALVNGLVAFAEGDPHSDDLCDLTELVNGLVEETDKTFAGRKIELSVQLPPLPVVPVPRVQLTTILRNIVQNAVDAMPEGGTLSIEASAADASVSVSISDTGRGLDEDAKARMFEPFWTTKRPDPASPGAATGLGLAIAHGLAQVIGASITVESEPLKGARFIVTLPRDPDHSSARV